jgi:hypothetical protein
MQVHCKARRGLRASVFVLTAIVLASVTSLSGSSAFATTKAVTPNVAAARGARWLSDQILANHGFVTTFGSADPTNTAYAVIALHAAHVGQQASDSALTYLHGQLASALKSGGTDAPGALAYYILAAVAAGDDPVHFGGSGPTNDLVARLLATQRASGPDAGLFGVQDPSFDGSFRQGLALLALHAVKDRITDLHVVEGIAWLAQQQCSNGLWESYRSNTAVACDNADPNTFTGPDTNSSSLAIQGLASWGYRPLQTQAVASLHASQSSDGGWPFVAAPGQASDPDSTALTIQALIAEKQQPTQTTWSVAGGTPLGALVNYQLGCTAAAGDRGAFFFPGVSGPNTLATVQAVPALLQKVFPVAKVAPLKSPPAPISCPS